MTITSASPSGVSAGNWISTTATNGTVEVDPSTVDLTDPKFLAVLQQPMSAAAPVVGRKADAEAPGTPKNVGNPPAQAGFGPMSLAQWHNTLRTDEKYGWDSTKNAQAEAMKLADQIRSAFGKKG